MADSSPLDLELTLQTLNYAARLVASELEWDRLVDRSLDALADFGQATAVALLTVDEEARRAEVAGVLNVAGLVDPAFSLSLADSPLAEVVQQRRAASFEIEPEQPLPLPARAGNPMRRCLCVPLLGGSNRVIGLVTLEQPVELMLSPEQMQVLNVVATLVAVTLENSRLFKLATVDGLTGLYVRRYFEIRLSEEVARLRRHGGNLALMLTDIDRFKQVNDTYGHQQGDHVLRELAHLLRGAVRKGLDIPCRYGGEEYVTILPMTPLAGAREVAERLRRTCQTHRFDGPAGAMNCTLSGGVAAIDQETACDEAELIRRADEALYAAKQNGRNQICVWEE